MASVASLRSADAERLRGLSGAAMQSAGPAEGVKSERQSQRNKMSKASSLESAMRERAEKYVKS